MDLCWQSDVFAFYTMSGFVIAFLRRSSHLRILWLKLPSVVILEPKERKSVTASTFSPSICHEVMGPDAMILDFLVMSFKLAFSHSCFTLIKKLFSSLLSAIGVMSSAYLRLLIFLLAVLIPAYNSSRPAFHMMYSAYKLNKRGDNIQPCHTPFSIVNQLTFPYKVLDLHTVVSSAYLRRQVRWSDITISLRVFHTVKGFTIINEIEVDVFMEFPCFVYDPANVGNSVSSSSAFSKPTLYVWKFLIQEAWLEEF